MSPLSFYKCLSEETRLVSVLLIAKQGPLCVCDLVTALGLSQPKVSRHLAELRECRLLQSERQGKWMHYSLHPDLPTWAHQVLTLTHQHNQALLQPYLENLTQTVTCC